MALRHLPFPLILLSFVPAFVTAAVVADEVPVRVYDSSALAGDTRRHALETARATLARAGVAVAWLACEDASSSPACTRGTGPGELVLRIVPAQRAGAAAGVAALRSGVSRLPLGDAFVDLATQSGVLATIYRDRVSALAGAAGIDAGTLLGYAIAHEIAHLLLGSNAHGDRGLMRPLWSRDEIRRGRAADWMLTEREASAIRARLEARRLGPR